MTLNHVLNINAKCFVKTQNAGLLISRGQGTHPTRVIDSHELILVKQGVLEMWEEDQTFSLDAGQTLHLWPFRKHGGVGTLPTGLEFYWIHFEIEACDNESSDLIEIPQVCHLRRPEKLESLFRYFLDGQEAGDLHAQSANMLMMLMLIEVGLTRGWEKGDSDKVNSLAAMVNTYIRMNYDRPISSGKVAKALGYNPDYLGRIYRQIYGITLTEAIHRCRVKMACRGLLDTDMTIEEVARSCGFSDADYFRRIFRRHMRCTPIMYRNLNARVHVVTH